MVDHHNVLEMSQVQVRSANSASPVKRENNLQSYNMSVCVLNLLLNMRHMPRVRTILILGYWVLGNIHRYWIILVLQDIFRCSEIQYNTNQTAVSTVHMPVNDYLVPLVLTDAIVCLDTVPICCCLLNTIIVIIIEFWDFLWSLLCYTLVSVLVLGIGIARAQYYWVIDIGCLSWYRSNPTKYIVMS